MTCSIIKQVASFDDLKKNYEFNYRWESKKVHIQGVVFFHKTSAYNVVCRVLAKILLPA